MDFGFSGAHGTNVSSVSNFPSGRDLGWLDEEHGVVAIYFLTGRPVLANALHAASPFVGERSCPDFGVGASQEGVHSFVFSGGGVQHLAGDGGIVLHRLGKEGRNAVMRPGVEVETGKTGSWTLALKQRRSKYNLEWG